MSKSNWEIWAEQEQPKKLQATATLQQAVELLKQNKGVLSELVLRGMAIMIERLYDVTDMELNRLIAGDEIWM